VPQNITGVGGNRPTEIYYMNSEHSVDFLFDLNCMFWWTRAGYV